jgi:EAL domain-containing protein (putative c-di-GMP-specific phosphodiesterase class I)/ActR/RegA family two-component response regulator
MNAAIAMQSGAYGRLLILDDDAAVGTFMESTAARLGFDARAAAHPDSFFTLVDQWSPTHIAIDLVMPEMDGVEVLVELAKRKCKARIIITSGIGGRVLEAAARSADEHGLNIIGALAKPFPITALKNLLLPAEPGPPVETKPAGPKKDANGEATTRLSSIDVVTRDFAHALTNHEVHLLYQPKVDCASGRLAGFEALARWTHPVHGLILPDQFIPFAETSGLIDALTDEVLDQAAKWLTTEWPRVAAAFPSPPAPKDAIANISMSINLSAKTLSDLAFVDRVTDWCEYREIDPARVIFELTETSAMEDPTTSLALLTRLRMKGFHLSIDDFGTGYSSMLQLVRMPFSEIKVDKSFVMTALKSKESRTVVRSIVELGRSLGIKVVAEGVEDSETLEYLEQIGCDLAQGYFVGRPMNGEALAQWVRRP